MCAVWESRIDHATDWQCYTLSASSTDERAKGVTPATRSACPYQQTEARRCFPVKLSPRRHSADVANMPAISEICHITTAERLSFVTSCSTALTVTRMTVRWPSTLLHRPLSRLQRNQTGLTQKSLARYFCEFWRKNTRTNLLMSLVRITVFIHWQSCDLCHGVYLSPEVALHIYWKFLYTMSEVLQRCINQTNYLLV